ncbi:hypothetical protein FRC04_001713 [Tulasnella sp. 424]|nr:hypothetical protein FRC04_001713 [Tulasnella sp. 424]KAG8975447.1 hypothetical protein FRC05_005777 [Tulasnella sp. 425]
MTSSESTKDSDDSSSFEYPPWTEIDDISSAWHTNTPFFHKLLNDLQTFDTLLNSHGICAAVEGLVECDEECDCEEESSDGSEDSGDSDYPDGEFCSAGRMGLENREFLILERWIPRVNEVVKQLVDIRDGMVNRATSTRKRTEESLALLDAEKRRLILTKFPVGADLHLIDSVDTSPNRSSDGRPRDNLDSRHVMGGDGQSSTRSASEEPQLGVLLQRLPAEVIHTIILEAQRSDPHIHLTLSHVSQFFRTFVNASPLLWSKLDLEYPLSMLSLYLERSGEARLDVIAIHGLVSSPSSSLQLKGYTKAIAFYKMLHPHRHRIRRLRLERPTSLYRENHVQSLPSDLPDHFPWSSMLCNLEYLELGFRIWETEEYPDWPGVTYLRELRLYGEGALSIVPFVLASVTHLTLGRDPGLSLQTTKRHLASAPLLESLTFSDVTLSPPPPDVSNDRVEMNSLEFFSATRSTPSTVQLLLQTIACPNLQALHIHFTGEVNLSSASVYRVFHPINVTELRLFSEPQYQIRKLDLVSCDAERGFLEATLENLPGLKDLRIASSALTNEHLEVLVVNASNNDTLPPTTRCPQLVSLTVDNEPAVSTTVIRRIAQSRNDASIPLHSVTLRGFDGARVFLDDLQSIRDSGVIKLTVSVFTEDEAVDSEKESEWSSSWSTDEGSEDELASGDEDVIAL